MASGEDVCRLFFHEALDSLGPENLFKSCISIENGPTPYLRVSRGDSTHLAYDLGRGCRLVGFGKAVLGMGAYICSALKEHISGGVLSVPYGIGLQGNQMTMFCCCIGLR